MFSQDAQEPAKAIKLVDICDVTNGTIQYQRDIVIEPSSAMACARPPRHLRISTLKNDINQISCIAAASGRREGLF